MTKNPKNESDQSKKSNQNKNMDPTGQVNLKAGMDQQRETKSLAEEGSHDDGPNVGRERGQPAPSEENTSPMADKIEAEKLAQYEKNSDKTQES